MKPSLLIAAILPVCFASSCVTGPYVQDPYIIPQDRQQENIYYVPSSNNTPMMSEKNDLSFNIVRNSSTKVKGADFQAAYLPAKHLGLIAAYSAAKNGVSPTFMNYHRFEVGAGYIKRLSELLHFETYAGAGKGKIENIHRTGLSTVKLTNFFVQPALALNNTMKTVSLGISSRFSAVNFSVQDTAFSTDREPFSKLQLEQLMDKKLNLMWEPSILLQVGWRNFKFHSAYTYAANLTNSDLNMSNKKLSLGVSLQFNAAKSKLKK